VVLDNSTENSGRYTSLAIGADGFPIISYSNFYENELRVVKCDDAARSGNDEIISLVDPVSPSYISMAIGEGGLPVISYFDNQSFTLKVAHCGTPSCSQLKVTP